MRKLAFLAAVIVLGTAVIIVGRQASQARMADAVPHYRGITYFDTLENPKSGLWVKATNQTNGQIYNATQPTGSDGIYTVVVSWHQGPWRLDAEGAGFIGTADGGYHNNQNQWVDIEVFAY